jgi:hypothetical protein
MDSKKQDPKIAFLNDAKEFFFGKNFWQAGLLEQIGNLTCEQALWRPFEGRHCIWEYVRHINFWKEWAVIYVKDGVKMNAKENNWEELPKDQSAENWLAEIEKTKLVHEHFTNVAESLRSVLYESTEENITWFRQVLLHDAYHCGQIGLVRAMQGISSVT